MTAGSDSAATAIAVDAVTAVEAVPMVQPLPVPAAPQPPRTPVVRLLGSGVASFYGGELHGRRTASGERFDMHALTAAHRTLPFGTRVMVTNPANGRSVTVRINDRGPFHGGRVIDVSRAAANELGLVARGHGTVELALVEG
ncbi:MAG: septal ring lytic transglycosylase RlpA family protein [Sphingomonadaceae bacterium]